MLPEVLLSEADVAAAVEAVAERIAPRIDDDTVAVVLLTGGIWYAADVPFGGYKASGIGREMGVRGFEEYLEIKAVARPV